MCRPQGRRYVPCRAQARRYRRAQGLKKCLARACGLEGLHKVLRRGEINPALLDQLRARLVSESVPHQGLYLILGERSWILLRSRRQRRERGGTCRRICYCSGGLRPPTGGGDTAATDCRPEGRRYNSLLRPSRQRKDQRRCQNEETQRISLPPRAPCVDSEKSRFYSKRGELLPWPQILCSFT